jgi:hypothetical protein
MRSASGRVVAVAVMLVLVACGRPPTVDAPRPSTPTAYGGTWRLVKGHGPDGDVPLVSGYRITLNIEDGLVEGTAACNR